MFDPIITVRTNELGHKVKLVQENHLLLDLYLMREKDNKNFFTYHLRNLMVEKSSDHALFVDIEIAIHETKLSQR